MIGTSLELGWNFISGVLEFLQDCATEKKSENMSEESMRTLVSLREFLKSMGVNPANLSVDDMYLIADAEVAAFRATGGYCYEVSSCTAKSNNEINVAEDPFDLTSFGIVEDFEPMRFKTHFSDVEMDQRDDFDLASFGINDDFEPMSFETHFSDVEMDQHDDFDLASFGTGYGLELDMDYPGTGYGLE